MSEPSRAFLAASCRAADKSSRISLLCKPVSHITPSKMLGLRKESPTSEVVLFFVKIAALETVRRLSRVKCPIFWQSIQALQVIRFTPLKWIRRWTPLCAVVNGIQKLSMPMLLISVTSAVADHCKHERSKNNNNDNMPQQHPELPVLPLDSNDEEPPEDVSSLLWLSQLFQELEEHNITLPERINEAELRRFYAVANDDVQLFMPLIKKTIRWRETFRMLPPQELKAWSHLVFWHGIDTQLRPCLFIRLGRGCSSLAPRDRHLFGQAVVSQIEHGVVNLMNNVDDPRITVLMDCHGLSPFRFPMQLMRSICTIVQENYPDRLGMLYVLHLPPVVRVIAHTFIQVLKPSTRQKIRVMREEYKKVLGESLQNLPSFLGGNCGCSHCLKIMGYVELAAESLKDQPHQTGFASIPPDTACLPTTTTGDTEDSLQDNYRNPLRVVLTALLVLWILAAFLSGIDDDDPL